jgi:hypothetical protein
MDTGISDIQKTKDDKVEITLCTFPSGDDFMKITLTKEQAWEIADFCHSHLSYGAKLKEEKNG